MSTSSSSGRLLALDLDGTLIEAEPRQAGALAELLAREDGVPPVERGQIWSWKRDGLSTRAVLERLGLDEPATTKLAEAWLAAVEDEGRLRDDRLLAGVPEVLEAVRGAGDGILILTARRYPDRALDQVRALGLLRWCSAVHVVAPGAAAEAKAAELTSRGCRGFVGDTESDAKAAEIAGVPFAAVTTGQRSREFLESRRLASFDSLAEAIRALGAD